MARSAPAADMRHLRLPRNASTDAPLEQVEAAAASTVWMMCVQVGDVISHPFG
jgi:hypothetical protein